MGYNQNYFLNETEWNRKYQIVLHIVRVNVLKFVSVMFKSVCTELQNKTHFLLVNEI